MEDAQLAPSEYRCQATDQFLESRNSGSASGLRRMAPRPRARVRDPIFCVFVSCRTAKGLRFNRYKLDSESIPQEGPMNKKARETIALRTLALIVVLSASWQAHAQKAKMPYPSTASPDHHLV